LNRLIGHVEWAITDSPLLLSVLYNKTESKSFLDLVKEVFNKYDNRNFYIVRDKAYQQIGRTQSEVEARELDEKMKTILFHNSIRSTEIIGDEYAVDNIYEYITRHK
jgi:hypothetical protein